MYETFLVLGFGIVVTILWLVIGWRAMKAHVRLAEEARRANDRLELLDAGNLEDPLKSKNRAYREFVRVHPGIEELNSKERHERFREWELEQGEENA